MFKEIYYEYLSSHSTQLVHYKVDVTQLVHYKVDVVCKPNIILENIQIQLILFCLKAVVTLVEAIILELWSQNKM